MSPDVAFGGRMGVGSRPALVVVDLLVGFCDPASPLACDATVALAANVRLLAAARGRGSPVVFTTVIYDPPTQHAATLHLRKVPALALLQPGTRWVEIAPELEVRPGEIIINKPFVSAFFGTALATQLRRLRVDTLVITGASTSGCVRATVVDALQHGFHVLVPREAVADRSPRSHEVALQDIDARYCDVISLETAAAVLGRTHTFSHPIDRR